MHCWQSRRGLQLRKFPALERPSAEQMQRKVRHRADGCESTGVPGIAHTCNWFPAPPDELRYKKGDHFTVSFWGPQDTMEQKKGPENGRCFLIQDLLDVTSLRSHERALGRHTAADDEDDDEESESELDERTATASSAAPTPSSLARPKKERAC